MFQSGCLLMQTTCGKGVRPLYKFTSLFRNTISKNYTDRIKVDRTCHSSIQNEYIFLSSIIQIHILNQTHTQALVSSSLLLWLVLAGLDPAAPCMLAAASTACFQASPLSSRAKHHNQEGKEDTCTCACLPMCVLTHMHGQII